MLYIQKQLRSWAMCIGGHPGVWTEVSEEQDFCYLQEMTGYDGEISQKYNNAVHYSGKKIFIWNNFKQQLNKVQSESNTTKRKSSWAPRPHCIGYRQEVFEASQNTNIQGPTAYSVIICLSVSCDWLNKINKDV